MEEWIKKLAIKTIKTMAQTAVGVIGASTIFSQVDWLTVASAVGMSGVVCILMNISQIGDK